MEIIQLSLVTLWVLVILNVVILIKHIRTFQTTPPSKFFNYNNVEFHKDKGIAISDQFPNIPLEDIRGNSISYNASDNCMFIFTSTGCKACSTLYPSISSFQKQYPYIKLFLFIYGDKETARQIITENELDNICVAHLRPEHLNAFKISIFPFSYLVSNNKVISKGVSNNAEHLHNIVRYSGIKKDKVS